MVADLQAQVLDQKLTVKPKLDSKELLDALRDFKLKKIEYEMEVGIIPAGDYTALISEYNQIGFRIKQEMAKVYTDISLTVEEKTKRIAELQTDLMENDNLVRDTQDKSYDYRLQKVQAEADKALETMQNSKQAEYELAVRYFELSQKAYDKFRDALMDSEAKSHDKEMQYLDERVEEFVFNSLK